jgi:hypothetical protein
MKKVALTTSQTAVLEKIAHRSKMDSWFAVDEKLEVREKDINDLMDGATAYDLDTLSGEEVYHLVNVLIKCNAIKR